MFEKSKKTDKNPSIQLLRGVLFLFILAFHCEIPFANAGWMGVEVFFVLSAFFVVLKYWGAEGFLLRKQLIHRMIRLYPPYLVVVLLAIAYAFLSKNLPYDLPLHLLSAQNYHWMITDYRSPMQPVTAHTWTLSIEVWGGFIWLLLIKYVSKKQFRMVMYLMLLLGIGYRTITVLCGANVWIISLCPLAHFDAFACGSLLAIALKEKKLSRGKLFVSFFVGILGVAGCVVLLAINHRCSLVAGYQLLSSSKNYLSNWATGNIYLCISLLAIGVVGMLCLKGTVRKGQRRSVMWNCLYVLGEYSYEMYLFHWPVLVVLHRLVLNSWVSFILCLAFTILAIIIFELFMSCIRKRVYRRKEIDSTL